jgi:hypothetical protein
VIRPAPQNPAQYSSTVIADPMAVVVKKGGKLDHAFTVRFRIAFANREFTSVY